MDKVNIKVIEVNRYRDGGTIEYKDEIGRLYWRWHSSPKVYNQYPKGAPDHIALYVKELPVELDIVKQF